MKTKFIILILLIIFLTINLYLQENFYSQNTLPKNKILNQQNISRILNEMDKQILEKDKSNLVNLLELSNSTNYHTYNSFSLKKNKILLTLYYDSSDKNSFYFYEDKNSKIDKYIIEESKYLYQISSDTAVFNDKFEKFFNLIKNEMHNRTNNKILNNKTWNMLKNNFLSQLNIYLNKNMCLIEEVECNIVDNIPNTSLIIDNAIQPTTQPPNKLQNTEKITIETFIKANNIIGVINTINSKFSSEFHIVNYDNAKTIQKSNNFINKLPMVTLSFVKPTVEINNEIPYIHNEILDIKYDGIYSMNNFNKPVGFNNLLNFIQENVDKYLEIKEDMNGGIINNTETKKIYHIDTFHSDKIVSGSTLDYETHYDIIEIPESSFKVYKCKYCSMFIKEFN